MADNTLHVNIVTPDGTVLSDDNLELVVIHTLTGELGIMANHTPVVSALAISELHLQYQGKKDITHFAVHGGFAEFSNNTLTVVASSAENAANIDVKRAEDAKRRADLHLKNAKNADDRRRAEIALTRAITRMQTSKLK